MTTFDVLWALSGYDISFSLASMTTGQYIEVISDIRVIDAISTSSLRVSNTSGNISVSLYASTLLLETFLVGTDVPKKIQVVFHQKYLSVNINGRWAHTFYPEYIKYYSDKVPVQIKANYAAAISNIRLKEFSDWRETVFIDLETRAQSALSSIIQQRPIDVYGKYDGTLRLQYTPTSRPTIAMSTFIRSHDIAEVENSNLSSEAIVYHTNTGVSVDQESLKRFGFITRVFRMPDLDAGAMRAASTTQIRARQSYTQHQLSLRFSPYLEVDDVVTDTLVLPGTSTQANLSVIIEEISFNISDGKSFMRAKGRKNE